MSLLPETKIVESSLHCMLSKTSTTSPCPYKELTNCPLSVLYSLTIEEFVATAIHCFWPGCPINLKSVISPWFPMSSFLSSILPIVLVSPLRACHFKKALEKTRKLTEGRKISLLQWGVFGFLISTQNLIWLSMWIQAHFPSGIFTERKSSHYSQNKSMHHSQLYWVI